LFAVRREYPCSIVRKAIHAGSGPKALELEPADFADTEEAKQRLREAVNEYMGQCTKVVSKWSVYDANQSFEHGFASKDKSPGCDTIVLLCHSLLNSINNTVFPYFFIRAYR
jgi:hypothetical protein